MTDFISVTRTDGISLVRMNRPDKKNALNGAMYHAMREEIEQASERGTRVIVWAGVPGAFSAGNDIGDFLAAASGKFSDNPAGRFIRALAVGEVPMVAAVDGLAIGIGTTMILHCDFVYASPRTMFRMPFVDLGVVPEAGSSLLLPRNVGTVKASEFLMLGEGFDAAEAHRLGLINAVVAEGEIEAKAMDTARRLLAKPKNALANTRRLIRGDRSEIVKRQDEEGELFLKGLMSEEAREAFMSFMAKKV